LFALQLEEWQVLAELRDATDFANWSRNKGGWDTLEAHHDPSRCAGATMESVLKGIVVLSWTATSRKITEIDLNNSNLSGGKFSLGRVPRYRTTSATTNTHSALPGDSIGLLSSLQTLMLHENEIASTIYF
jgi:hypothetical protein